MDSGGGISSMGSALNPKMGKKPPVKKAVRRSRVPRPRKMKYVNREKCRDIARLRAIIAHMNNQTEEHYMLVVAAHDPRKHLSFFGSKPLVRAALTAQFRNHILHDIEEEKESMYVPYVRDIGAQEIENLTEHQLSIGISHMLDLYNYPMKQHYVYKKNKADIVGNDRQKPKPLFWHPMIRFVNFPITDLSEVVEPEYTDSFVLNSKRDAMKLVFTNMLLYYKKIIQRLYNEYKSDDIDLMGLDNVFDHRTLKDVPVGINIEEEDGDDDFINVDDCFEPQIKKEKLDPLEQEAEDTMNMLIGASSSGSSSMRSAPARRTAAPVHPLSDSKFADVEDNVFDGGSLEDLNAALSIGGEVVVKSGQSQRIPGNSTIGRNRVSTRQQYSSPMLSHLHDQQPESSGVSHEEGDDTRDLFRLVRGKLARVQVNADGTTTTGTDGKLYRLENGVFRQVYRGEREEVQTVLVTPFFENDVTQEMVIHGEESGEYQEEFEDAHGHEEYVQEGTHDLGDDFEGVEEEVMMNEEEASYDPPPPPPSRNVRIIRRVVSSSASSHSSSPLRPNGPVIWRRATKEEQAVARGERR